MNWKNRGMEKQSDATSVQPLWHSLVDLSIIGLDVEDGDDAGVTVGGGEEDLRPLETAPRVLLRCDTTPSSEKRVYKGRSNIHGVGSIMDGDN